MGVSKIQEAEGLPNPTSPIKNRFDHGPRNISKYSDAGHQVARGLLPRLETRERRSAIPSQTPCHDTEVTMIGIPTVADEAPSCDYSAPGLCVVVDAEVIFKLLVRVSGA